MYPTKFTNPVAKAMWERPRDSDYYAKGQRPPTEQMPINLKKHFETLGG